ncbi:MAG: ribosome recycling factor [Patescibacteria group bacterium]
MPNEFIVSRENDFVTSLEHFKRELASLRAGRANPIMIENILVDVYGSKTPLKQIGSIAVQEARTMLVDPWDKNLLKEVEKAITLANLGLSVGAEGNRIRVTVPAMTEENRRDLVKLMSEKLEDAKVSVRGVREEVKSKIMEAFKGSEITEDDKFAYLKELDEKVSKLNQELIKMAEEKEKEIMSV